MASSTPILQAIGRTSQRVRLFIDLDQRVVRCLLTKGSAKVVPDRSIASAFFRRPPDRRHCRRRAATAPGSGVVAIISSLLTAHHPTVRIVCALTAIRCRLPAAGTIARSIESAAPEASRCAEMANLGGRPLFYCRIACLPLALLLSATCISRHCSAAHNRRDRIRMALAPRRDVLRAVGLALALPDWLIA